MEALLEQLASAFSKIAASELKRLLVYVSYLFKWWPGMLAQGVDRKDILSVSARMGADKDAATKYGHTALHYVLQATYAAELGQLEIARLLVRARADRAKKNEDGQTALEVARQEGKAEVDGGSANAASSGARSASAAAAAAPPSVTLTSTIGDA